jgi:hypothetical protein
VANPDERRMNELWARLRECQEEKNTARAVVIKAERTGNAVKIRDAERELKRLVNHCSSIARQLEALGEKVTWSH